MSYSENSSVTPRPTLLPPISYSTMHHPSLLPYMINPTSYQIYLHGGNQTVFLPEELVYSNPTISGMRLNTAQPIMSACEAPPNQPDPFICGTHPTRDLGSPSWRIHSSQTQPRQAIIQLTAEEDQAITNLLKLHHQDAAETTVPAGPAESSPGCSAISSVSVDAQYPERRQWVEAALLTGFNQQDTDSDRTQNKTAGLEGPPQNPGTLPVWSKKHEGENTTAPLRPVNLKKRRLEELTDLEEDAVSVLLSLSDAVIL